MDQSVITAVDPSTSFASAKKEYIAAPTKTLLKFNVAPFETTQQINKFKTTPDGKTNPDFGKPQPVLIFKGRLAEGEAAGQLYSTWITGYYKDGDESQPRYSMGERSKFGKVAEALVGSVDAFQKLTAGDIEGMPFQCSLKPSKNNPDRLVLDIDKIMPPTADQKRIEHDTVVADIPENVEDLDAAFDMAIAGAK